MNNAIRINVVTALLVLFSASNGLVLAQSASVVKVKTDHEIYEPGEAPALPKAGEQFTDPVFGTTLIRLTDERDGKQNNVSYSYWPTFNKDATRLHISSGGEPFLYQFDPSNLKLVGKKEPLYAKRTPENSALRWEDSTWSATEPNIIFGHDMQRLWAYDVVKKEYQLLKDFGGKIQQMSRSIDDKVFAFGTSPAGGGEGYVVWQREGDKIVEGKLETLDEVQIDKAGQFLLIKTSQQGKGLVQAQVLNLATGKTEDLIDDEPDYAPGHSDNGHGFVIGHDNWRNQITGRRLATPHEHITILDLKGNWIPGLHISMLADDERWVLMNFYGKGNRVGPFEGEILQVSTDGKQRVRRLAHHRTVDKGDYWKIPSANISRDGKFVAFTSNYNGSGQTDVFILVVPPITGESDYEVKGHPLMAE